MTGNKLTHLSGIVALSWNGFFNTPTTEDPSCEGEVTGHVEKYLAADVGTTITQCHTSWTNIEQGFLSRLVWAGYMYVYMDQYMM